MKKIITLILLATLSIGISKAQTLNVNVRDIENFQITYCADTVYVWGDSTSFFGSFYRPDWTEEIDSFVLMVTKDKNQGMWCYDEFITYNSYDLYSAFFIIWLNSASEPILTPFEKNVNLNDNNEIEIYAYYGEELENLTVVWNDGDTVFSRFVGAGDYVATVSDDCGRFVENIWHVENCSSLEENLGVNSIFIYPNPAQGSFIVKGEGQMIVYNAIGQVVRKEELKGEMAVELPAGIYIVQVNGNKPQKVVVE